MVLAACTGASTPATETGIVDPPTAITGTGTEADGTSETRPSSVAEPTVTNGDPQLGAATATEAAFATLNLSETLVGLTPDAAAKRQYAISTADSADRLADRVRIQTETLNFDAPGGVTIRIAPLATTETPNPDIDNAVDVSIWYVEVIAITNVVAVDSWRTITYTLEPHNNQWLVADWTSHPGPAPARGPNQAVSPTTTITDTIATWNPPPHAGRR